MNSTSTLRRAIVLGLLPAAMMGCSPTPQPSVPAVTPSQSTGSAATSVASSSSTSARATPTEDRAAAYSRVQTEISQFLEAWRDKGYVVASQTYLVADQQLPPTEPAPILTAGRVVAFRPGNWVSADSIAVDVDMDLKFSGNAGAWGNGKNNRFVIATARTGAIPYVLEFNTSP